jgi:hypothetical protein
MNIETQLYSETEIFPFAFLESSRVGEAMGRHTQSFGWDKG